MYMQLSKELRSISLEAIIHHNDCLYLAHESLGLSYQVWCPFFLTVSCHIPVEIRHIPFMFNECIMVYESQLVIHFIIFDHQ